MRAMRFSTPADFLRRAEACPTSLTRAKRRHCKNRQHRFAVQEPLEDRRLLSAVFTITSTANGGAGSLRHAILEADAAGAAATIDFDIPGSGIHTISTTSVLPALTQSSITLDGTSQPGYSNSPLIQLTGSAISSADNPIGLDVEANGATIEGLIINGFTAAGIQLGNPQATATFSQDTVSACWIGTDPTGAAAGPTQALGIDVNSNDDIIGGGDAAADSNVISGNQQDGILIYGGESGEIENDLIGTNAAGGAAVRRSARQLRRRSRKHRHPRGIRRYLGLNHKRRGVF